MRKIVKFSLALIAVVLLLAQFVRPAKTNPPVDPAARLEAHAQVPPEVQKILARSCNDCHSNQTTWPWYSNVAPASWLVVDDVNHGRSHLNFSEWAGYDAETKVELLKEMCEEVTEGKMPLPIYLTMHNGARVSSDEARALCEWTRVEAAKVKSDGAQVSSKAGTHGKQGRH